MFKENKTYFHKQTWNTRLTWCSVIRKLTWGSTLPEAYSGLSQTSNIYFHKMLHVQCLTGSWIHLCTSDFTSEHRVIDARFKRFAKAVLLFFLYRWYLTIWQHFHKFWKANRRHHFIGFWNCPGDYIRLFLSEKIFRLKALKWTDPHSLDNSY